MHHQDREAISAGAEKTDIAEREITGETIDDVHALGEDQEDHEVEQQQMVLIDAWGHREDRDQRHQDEQRVLDDARQRAPAFRASRSDAAAGSGSEARKEEDRPTKRDRSAPAYSRRHRRRRQARYREGYRANPIPRSRTR